MNFEWDESTNRANVRKHGLDFQDAEEMFRGVVAAEPDTREDYGEKRWVGLGLIHGRVTHWFSRNANRTPFASSRSERQPSVKANSTKKRSKTDWKRVDALRDSDSDFSDSPELGPDFFKNAIIWPGPKKQITLRIDPDVLTFFRKHGRGYQSTINAVLRKYMEARKERAV